MSYKIEPRSMQEDYMVIHENSYIERAKLSGYGSSHEKHQALEGLGGDGGDMAAAFGQTDRTDTTQQIQDTVDLPDQQGEETEQDGGTNTDNPALDDIVYRLMQNPSGSAKEINDNMELLTDQLQDLIHTDKAGNTQHAGIQRDLQRGLDSFNAKLPTYQAFLTKLEENKENIADQLKKAEEKLNPKTDDQENQEDKTNGLGHRKTSLLESPDKTQGRKKVDGADLSDKEKQELTKKIQSLKNEVADYQGVIDDVNSDLQRAKDLQTNAKAHFEKLPAQTTQQLAGAGATTDNDQDGDSNTNGETPTPKTHMGGGKVRGPQDDITDPYEVYKQAHPELFGGTATEGEGNADPDANLDPLQAYLTRRQQDKAQAQQPATAGQSETDTTSLISQILASTGQGSALLGSDTDTSGFSGMSGLTGMSGTGTSETSQAQIQALLQQYKT